jgi:site-specific DNA recombinase
MQDMKRVARCVSQNSLDSHVKQKVVGYVRLSSKTMEKKTFSRDLQEKSLRDFVQAHSAEMELEKIYVDSAISGTEKGINERIAFFEMLKFLESNGPTKVIVYDLSRLWRDELTSAMIKRELKKRQASIVSIQQPQYSLDSESPSEFLVSSIFESIATFDRMNLIVKMNNGRMAKLIEKKGYPGGGVPLGFIAKDKELVVHEKEMELVKWIYRKRRYSKWSEYKIALTLRNQGMIGKNGGQFMPATIRKILKCKLYKGYFSFSKKLYPSSLGKIL